MSISVSLCPLPSCIQCRNAETKKYSPWVLEGGNLGSSELLDLAMNLGDVFLCMTRLLLLLWFYGPTNG